MFYEVTQENLRFEFMYNLEGSGSLRSSSLKEMLFTNLRVDH